MKPLRKEVMASVVLMDVRVSEDELVVFESALSYALDRLGDAELERQLGATRDEVEGIRDDLREALGAGEDAEPLVELTEKS